MKKLVSPVTMFLFGVIAFAAIMIITRKMELSFDSPNFWFYRVLTALAAASISISIPGMISINHVPQKDQNGNVQTFQAVSNMSLLDKEPTVSASGAIAVFVLVYLFNPLV
ncbi:hypothetical protein [Psychroserpens algicola]|uniref:Uncharacterized protein n=1 Tax=Psychroserpens algicola TaxID=1719034 RepID=A0ABT0HB37_9FLAO|nr:hypothetical protein [Psychroserpens algicola]MCK8481576.1 hypothetical protein [Psychroserpens algicola]